MGSITELSQSWDRLNNDELGAIIIIANDHRTRVVSQKLATYLQTSLKAELQHRDNLKSKPPQIPVWDEWTDAEVADAYMAGLMIQRACSAYTEHLIEWSELLTGSVCLEMVSRLHMRHSYTEVMGRCENN